jgi:cytochrome c55X
MTHINVLRPQRVQCSSMRTLMIAFIAHGFFAAGSVAAEPDMADPRLVRLVRQDCGSCHGMTLQGGLGTPLTREALSGKPADSLAATILYGRPGTAMPAWKTLLTEAQAQWIANRLLDGFPEE